MYEVPGKGGIGIPGDFTVDAGGDTQIVGFQWQAGYTDSGYVAADRPGGTATVRYTPRSDGPMSMSACGVDAAGNSGPSGDYRFFVARNGPSMTCTPARAFLGEPGSARSVRTAPTAPPRRPTSRSPTTSACVPG